MAQFFEVVAPGAFSDSLRDDDQVCFFNHDANQILGRKKSGTLVLEDSSTGLHFRCQLDQNNPSHRSVYQAIRRGNVDGCSFNSLCPMAAINRRRKDAPSCAPFEGPSSLSLGQLFGLHTQKVQL